MACSSGSSCNAFFSKVAADKIRGDCVSLGDTITTDCLADYSVCCIHTNGSNDLPEAICVRAARATELKAACKDPGYIYCGP